VLTIQRRRSAHPDPLANAIEATGRALRKVTYQADVNLTRKDDLEEDPCNFSQHGRVLAPSGFTLISTSIMFLSPSAPPAAAT